MRIEAEFCISHGDEMKRYGMTMYRCGDVDTSLMGFNWAIENMAAHLITGALHEQAEGRLGENAHLVTHPYDRRSRESF